MKKRAFAFAAVIAVSSFAATAADAMNIGSLSRQRPAVQVADAAALSYRAVCGDLSCGVGARAASDYSPVLHIAFSSIGGFVRSHLDQALVSGWKASVQLISTASLD